MIERIERPEGLSFLPGTDEADENPLLGPGLGHLPVEDGEIDLEPEAKESHRAQGDPVRMYLREIGKTPLLTAKQEVEICRRIEAAQVKLRRSRAEFKKELALLKSRDGLSRSKFISLSKAVEKGEHAVREAKHELTEANLRLVVFVAKRYVYYSGMPILDLIQEGNIGLMKAVDKFNYKRGNKFSTYATWWIRQAVSRAVADQSRTIRIPVHAVETLNRLSRVGRVLSNELGREPTIEELAQRSGVSVKKAELVLSSARNPLSTEMPIGEDSQLSDFLKDDDIELPSDLLLSDDLGKQTRGVLNTLPPREAEILRFRHGIGEKSEHTLQEIGDRFSVSRERIRQVEAKAMKRLRHPIRRKVLEPLVKN